MAEESTIHWSGNNENNFFEIKESSGNSLQKELKIQTVFPQILNTIQMGGYRRQLADDMDVENLNHSSDWRNWKLKMFSHES